MRISQRLKAVAPMFHPTLIFKHLIFSLSFLPRERDDQDVSSGIGNLKIGSLHTHSNLSRYSPHPGRASLPPPTLRCAQTAAGKRPSTRCKLCCSSGSKASLCSSRRDAECGQAASPRPSHHLLPVAAGKPRDSRFVPGGIFHVSASWHLRVLGS